MDSIIEVIQHVFLGSSSATENSDLLREHGVTHLLGASHAYNLRERRIRFGGLILGCKNVFVTDTLLEVVEECNEYIHFCRKNGFNLLVHSPRSLPLSNLLIAFYLTTVSNCSLSDTVQLLRQFRPDHDLSVYKREWNHFETPHGPCSDEIAHLDETWGEKQPTLTYFDYAILTQLHMEARRISRRRASRRSVQISESQHDQLLTWKALEEHRRSLLLDKTVKEETQRREMKERRREEKYQISYAPDYKLTYDCHEFDESIFHNNRVVDFYLPSSIDSMLRLQRVSTYRQVIS
ncbi:hypothetical protein BOX15_Mlig005663g2 [Macrostomum lignano]|uniref:Tyrosine-protein phosphatase domain-containing protein n=2 Tax=Macrostomum lignano TaxID=282301 RepID=A0A1I8IZV4_9PLAT|nr:hypothetical protein BOX15_Mlig005663g1 [Macrostomum lignano]PAA78263.1 hypothetical protein BOX15_Mlig005663g2 [Macrostomum lignano]